MFNVKSNQYDADVTQQCSGNFFLDNSFVSNSCHFLPKIWSV